jgi:hypothetical protein
MHYAPISQEPSQLSDPVSQFSKACIQVTFVSLNKSSDTGNLDVPNRSHKMFPLSEKMKIIKEKSHAEVTMVMSLHLIM